MTGGLERRLLGAAIVLFLSVSSVLAVRKLEKPTAESAPEFRQKGAADSCVVVAEFSDFECPACRMAEPGVKNLLSLYGPNTRFIFKQFPLPARVHPWSKPAAVIAECAGRQGKFWEVHDALYEHQREWGDIAENPEQAAKADPYATITPYAVKAGADENALRACVNDPAVAAAIEADVKEGNDRWVGSTPTFFINRRRFAGSQQFQTLGTVWIDKILKTCKK